MCSDATPARMMGPGQPARTARSATNGSQPSSSGRSSHATAAPGPRSGLTPTARTPASSSVSGHRQVVHTRRPLRRGSRRPAASRRLWSINGRLRRASGDWRTGRRTTGPPSGDSPEAWPDLLGLDPASGPGSLVWRVVADALKSPEAGVRVNRTNRRRSRRSAIESTPQTRPLQIAARPQTTCGSRSRGACSTRTHRRPSGSSVAGSRPYSISPAFRRQPRLQSSGRSLAGSTTRPDRRRPRSAPVAPRRRGARFLRRRR